MSQEYVEVKPMEAAILLWISRNRRVLSLSDLTEYKLGENALELARKLLAETKEQR